MTTGPTRECLVGSLRGLLVFQRDVATCYMHEKGLTVSHVERLVKRTFEGAIVGVYREVLQSALTKAGGDLVEVAIRLKKDKSLRSRWGRGKVVPDWDTLCLAIAAFDVDVGGGLPRGRRAVIEAIKKTLVTLQVDLFRESATVLSDGDLACLHYASLNVRWWHAQKTRDRDQLLVAVEDIADRVAAEIPGKRITTHTDVEDTIRGWAKCWFVFHNTVPYDWQYVRATEHASHTRRT